MKKHIIIFMIIIPFLFNECGTGNAAEPAKTNPPVSGVIQLTNETFRKLIFNYELNKDWKYEGDKPAIIDFYADWCPPCRQLSPLVEEISKEYSGRINVYRVDTDKEKVLAQAVGITQLPTLLFIPSQGRPQITVGAIPKESLIKVINEILLIK